MRKYQAIWEQVKKAGSVTVVAPPSSHTRLINAVKKEKVKDIGWALLQLETDNKKYMLFFDSKDSHLRFWIEERSNLIDKL